MKSLLVHIASVAVILHMTFGCLWHHGLGTAHACGNPTISSCCSQHGDHDKHDSDEEMTESHPHSGLPTAMLTVAMETVVRDHLSKHQHQHQNCDDDSCFVPQRIDFGFVLVDFSAPYLGDAGIASLAKALSNPDLAFASFPERPHQATGMRAHLLLGVQIL